MPLLLMLLLPVSAAAVTLEAGDAQVGIAGYLESRYTFMERLPSCATPACASVTATPVTSSLDQSLASLILRVDRKRMRGVVNLLSGNAYPAGGGGGARGSLEFTEAYGEYRRGPGLNVRAGTFLAPFGFYNDARYTLTAYSPVVLPTFYQPLPNYADSGGLGHLVPYDANLMVAGAPGRGWPDYALYVASGERQTSGADANRDKGIGGRLLWRPVRRLTVGASAYTVDDGIGTTPDFGRRCHRMASLGWDTGRVSLRGELLRVNGHEAGLNVVGEYLYLSGRIGRAEPFIGFDRFRDKANPLYADGMDRWSAGARFQVNANLHLKAGFDYQTYDTPAVTAAGLDSIRVARLEAILVF